MAYKVRLFELPHNYDSLPVAFGQKPVAPVEVAGFAIDAANHDLAHVAVRERLNAYAYTKVRSISALADGSAHFAAVVYALPPKKET